MQIDDDYLSLSEEDIVEDDMLKDLAKYRELASGDPDTYEPKVAELSREIGVKYHESDYYKTSEKYWLEALDNYRRCYQRDPDTYEPDLAMILFLLGGQCQMTKRYTKCGKYYFESLGIWKRLSAKDPEKYGFFMTQIKDLLKTLHEETANLSEEEKMRLEEEFLEKDEPMSTEDE